MKYQLIANADEVTHHETLESVAAEIARRYTEGPATFSARLFRAGRPASGFDADEAQRLAAVAIVGRS
jgi:tRNA(Ser,Leu) C12 N-acetylase TAN1